MTLPSAGTLERLKARSESAMRDELRLQSADTATDNLGHTYETGTYSTQYTVPCRRQRLTGRDLEVARGLTTSTQGVVACPDGTPVLPFQRFQVYKDGALVLTARVVWIDQDTSQVDTRFYYEALAQ